MSSISDQFKGLPIGELISQPLIAAAQAQGKLAGITEQFIKEVGLQDVGTDPKKPILKARTVEFDYDAVVEKKSVDATTKAETTTTTTAAPTPTPAPTPSPTIVRFFLESF